LKLEMELMFDRDRLEITFTYLVAKKIRIFNDLNTKEVEVKLD